MFHKPLTILSLIGLLLSVAFAALWISAEYKIKRLNARIQAQQVGTDVPGARLVVVSAFDKETGEPVSPALGKSGREPANLVFFSDPSGSGNPSLSTRVFWFDYAKPFEIMVAARGYEMRRVVLDLSTPRELRVALQRTGE
jgi:hypothetical protein